MSKYDLTKQTGCDPNQQEGGSKPSSAHESTEPPSPSGHEDSLRVFQQVVQEIESRQLGSTFGREHDGYQALKRFLNGSLSSFEWRPGTHRVLVVGTNGKGSVCATLTQILVDQGFRVGTFTSPHLQSITERIRIDGTPVEPSVFVKAYGQAIAFEGSEHLTRFELLTVMSCLIFQGRIEGCAAVNCAIFEAGIGGRKDATRAIDPSSVIVTRLGLDHTDILGPDLNAIRTEKMAVIHDRLEFPAVVQEQMSPVSFAWHEGLPPRTEWVDEGRSWPLGIPGRMGAEAAQLTMEWCRRKGLSLETAATSLSKVKWPGRQEFIVSAGTNVLLSGDHNPQGIDLLLESLPYYQFKTLRFVVGVSSSKDVDSMMSRIGSTGAEVWFTRTPFRGMSDAELLRWSGPRVHVESDPLLAFGKARQGLGPKDLVVVTGSLYLVGLIRSKL